MLQRDAACCSVIERCDPLIHSVLQCVAVCCSTLQCVAMCCSVLQSVAVFCTLLQPGAVWCSTLQFAAKREAPVIIYFDVKVLADICVCMYIHVDWYVRVSVSVYINL